MTPLARHLAANDGVASQRELAEQLGVSEAFLSQIKHGKRRISLDLAFRLEHATGGAVRASDWLSLEPGE